MRHHPQDVTPLSRSGARAEPVEAPRIGGSLRHCKSLSAAAKTALGVAVMSVLASCATDDAAQKPKADPGVGARLWPTSGSAVRGFASFQPYEGGVTAAVTVWTGNTGTMRVVIHSTGICTSPNGFSAGPPWIPP